MRNHKLVSVLTVTLFLLSTVALSAQTKFYVYQKNGTAVAYNIDNVDSISFTPPITEDFNIEMVSVGGGTFAMGSLAGDGSENERPQHQVTLRSFNIGKYEVTQGQWKAVMGTDIRQQIEPGWNLYGEGDDYPMYYVSWNDIVGTSGASTVINGITYYENGFIYRLNQLMGKNYRLPTEAEWEYAAREGNTNPPNNYTYSGSNNVDDVAWYWDNSNYSAHQVGTKQANELGTYDMSGNVWEWCSDWFGSYTAESQDNPTGPDTGTNRVARSGSWKYDSTYCRVARRDQGGLDYRGSDVGFRVVLH